MRHRRHRAPETQLARAGERTQLLIGNAPIQEIRFKATVLDGDVAGRLSVETVNGTRTEALAEDNRLDAHGLISLSVVPENNTAITFVKPDNRPFSPMVAVGAVLILGAVGWTAWDIVGG
ncbi:MAG: hypothetical protein AAF409_04760 [Pseudomonadota bacterium]